MTTTLSPIRVLPIPRQRPPRLTSSDQPRPSREDTRPRAIQDALAVDFASASDEQLFGPQPTGRGDLPDPEHWAAHLAQAVVEVMAGSRQAPQILRWTTPRCMPGRPSRGRRPARRRPARRRGARRAGLRARRRGGRGQCGRRRRDSGARPGHAARGGGRSLAHRGAPGRLTDSTHRDGACRPGGQGGGPTYGTDACWPGGRRGPDPRDRCLQNRRAAAPMVDPGDRLKGAGTESGR